MKVFGVVYLLIDGTNDLEYVGQTVNLKSRLKKHRSGDQYVDRAIRAHGWENCVVAILKECESKEELDYWEKYFIKARNTRSPNGYNLTDGGEGSLGIERTPEYRANCSVRLMGEKNHRYGKKNTPEHQAKIVAANKGAKRTAETCANIAAGLVGKPFTPERCSNISIANRHPSPYKNLIAELDRRMLSFAKLAKRIGISQASISRKMNGLRKFSDEEKSKLEEILELPADYLLQRYPCEEINEQSVENTGSGSYKNLSDEMEKQGVTLHQLSEALGLIEATVYSKIRGERNFTARDKVKLEELLQKPIEYLLQREDKDCAKLLPAKPRNNPCTNLLSEMKKQGIAHRQLAKFLGLAESTVYSKINGASNFTARDKVKLEELLQKPIEYLLKRDD